MGLTLSYVLIFFCCIVPSHHLQEMKESSDEEYMIPTSEKASSLANWSSIPSRKSARIRSGNLELEKPRKISKLMDCEADTKTEVTKPVKLKGDSSFNILLFLLV